MSYLIRTGLAVIHWHSRGRTYRQVDTEACAHVRARTHTHTHTHTHSHNTQTHRHTHTHTHTHTHARARAQTHTPSPDGDSPRRVTRAWDSYLFFGRTLLDMVTMCDLRVSIVVLAVGLALSLQCGMLASDLIICLARPHGSCFFFFFFLAKPCRTWW